jgi:hypothetical protein
VKCGLQANQHWNVVLSVADLRQLAQGLYDYPRVYKQLGILAPNPDDVAAVLAAKTGSRVQISGARAANLLGSSTKSPLSWCPA